MIKLAPNLGQGGPNGHVTEDAATAQHTHSISAEAARSHKCVDPPGGGRGRGREGQVLGGLAADADGVADGLGRWPVAGPEVRWFVVGCYGSYSRGPGWAGRIRDSSRPLLVYSYPLLDCISAHLRSIQPALAGQHWLVNGFCPFAADGSRSECPRTRANQAKLRRAGRKKTGPQLFVTTVYHLGSGLPWCYRIGPGIDSERNHLRSMFAPAAGGQPADRRRRVCWLRVADRDHRPGVALSDPGGAAT